MYQKKKCDDSSTFYVHIPYLINKIVNDKIDNKMIKRYLFG